MSKLYANPFSWGEPVKGGHYVQRPEDHTFIQDCIESQSNLLLTGQRGTGKTSLLNFVLDKNATASAHLDLRFIVSRYELSKLLAKALVKCFPQLENDDRLKSLSPDNQTVDLKSIFDLWYEKVKVDNKQFVMVWDEFHHLDKFKRDMIEEIRQSLKGRRGITHIFVSHRKDILQDAFGNDAKAFFKNQKIYELGNLNEKDFTKYLTQRFRRMGLSDFDLPVALFRFTNGQPLFTQRLAYTLAQIWLEGTTTRLLQRSITKLLKERNVLFTAMWDTFGLNEKRLLLGLASGYSHPTELGFIAKFGLSATSTAHNTVVKLLREGWLLNRDEGYHIYDPLFLKWLQKQESLL